MTSFIELKRKQAKAALIARHPALYWAYRKLRRGWAERELALLPALCGECALAVDVGANHGLFTHYLASLCGHVHAFEASPCMAEILRRGYLRRGNVTVHQLALSNVDGTATLQVPKFLGLSGYATLEDSDLSRKIDVSDGLERIEVPTRRLDSFELRDLGFLKVDVEGHELEVLEGARDTLQRASAVVLAELEERHRAHAVRDVRALLEGLGYQGYFLRGSTLTRIASFDPALHQDERRPEHYVRNFLFVAPARRAGLAAALALHGVRVE